MCTLNQGQTEGRDNIPTRQSAVGKFAQLKYTNIPNNLKTRKIKFNIMVIYLDISIIDNLSIRTYLPTIDRQEPTIFSPARSNNLF